MADEYRLQQILHNLVGNAIKFTEEGVVRLEAVVDEQSVTISVRDSGIGIEPAQQQRIFDMFEQIDDSERRAQSGVGLGLSIVRKLVELQGGRVGVESAPGQGARFFFTLPVSAQPATDRPDIHPELSIIAQVDADEASDIVEATDSATAFTVLVVDDEPVNRHVLGNFLAGRFRVLLAADGDAALEILTRETVDIVLLDIMMPSMSGYEVCQRIRQQKAISDLPVVLLTARNQAQDLLEGFAGGANDYIIKPVVKAELLARVDLHLRLLDISRHLEAKVEARTADLAAANEQLKLASETDFLTHLRNRRAFTESAEALIRADKRFSIALCDIDNFKRINDQYGHECGDYVLQTVAEVFRNNLRKQDIAARWGGEEFIVLLQETDLDEATVVIDKLRTVIATQAFVYDGQSVPVTSTFGVSELGRALPSLDDTVRYADAALYQGKQQGKNRVIRSSVH